MFKNKLYYLISMVLILIGMLCIYTKGLLGEYIDQAGVLHEHFFLLPVGFSFIFLGLFIAVAVLMIQLLKKLLK